MEPHQEAFPQNNESQACLGSGSGFGSGSESGSSSNSASRVDDLPKAWITDIMKHALPPHSHISKETKQVMQKCVTEFICFVTNEAITRCHQEKRVKLHTDDVIVAMKNLRFHEYVPLLIDCKKCYREFHKHSHKGVVVPSMPPPQPFCVPMSGLGPVVVAPHEQEEEDGRYFVESILRDSDDPQ